MSAKFFGLSVSSFEVSGGFNEQSSTLTVTLAQDVTDGDIFIQPVVGQPAIFTFETFSFGGIVQNWEKNNSPAETYTVVLNDPRELLANVQVILSGYTGTTFGIPNLINAYGYLENEIGFWESRLTEGGIPWTKITSAISQIFQQGNTTYGGPIQFRGVNYLVDLTALPSPPIDYRLSGTSISLLDAISQVCRDCGADYYCDLVLLNNNYTIRIRPVSRASQPVVGQIASFIQSVTGAVSKQIGVELRNDVTSTVLAGGPVEYFSVASGSFDSLLEFQDDLITSQDGFNYARHLQDKRQGYVTDTPKFNLVGANVYPGSFRTPYITEDLSDLNIWPYWGLDSGNSTVIGTLRFDSSALNQGAVVDFKKTVGEMFHDNHRISLDARRVDVFGIGDTYVMDIGELRAAIEGQDGWRDYIHSKSLIAAAANNQNDPYLYRDIKLGIHPASHPLTSGEIDKIYQNRGRVLNLLNKSADKARYEGQAADIENESNLEKLYGYVKSYADEYYGRKFMVQTPFVNVLRDPLTRKIIQTDDPIDAAWVGENDAPLGLSLLHQDLFLTPENKIEAFARFSPASGLDTSKLNKDDYVIEQDVKFVGGSAVYDPNNSVLFVKCQVDPNYVFRDYDNLESPRAVVTLPQPVYYKRYEYNAETNFGLYKQLYDLGAAGVPAMLKCVGAKEAYSLYGPIPAYPEAIAVPLKSNTRVYGPWYQLGAVGRVNFEQDETLVPWNYGGYSLLNEAGANKVLNNTSNQLESETGTVQVPGAPSVSIGDVLIAGGPNVTNISVNVGKDGITTTYSMKTFTPEYGRFAKTNADRFIRMGKFLNFQNRRFRHLLNLPRPGAIQYKAREFAGLSLKQFPTKVNKPGTPHGMLVGQSYTPWDGSGTSAHVVSETFYEAIRDFSAHDPGVYQQRAGMSWEGLLRPFSTDFNASNSGLPHFERPTVSGSRDITVNQLNPFKRNHDIEFIVRGNEYPRSGLSVFEGEYDPDGIYRPLALRAPLILAGWGYTTSGKPVPNSGQYDSNGNFNPSGKLKDEFLDGYLRKSDTWKVGPLDSRWDDRRKVWVAGGGEQRVVRILDFNAYPSGDNAPKLGPSGLTAFTSGVFPHYPSGHGLNVYYAREMEVDFEEYVTKNHGPGTRGPFVTVSGTDNYLYVGNFRDQVVIPSSYFLASNINGKWFLENQATFLEYM